MNVYSKTVRKITNNIIEAVNNSDIICLQNIIANHPNQIVNIDEEGNSALHLACNKDNFEAIKLLLNTKINLNLFNKKRQTALNLAQYSKNNFKITKLLVESGANPTICSSINLALKFGNVDSFRYLMDYYKIHRYSTEKSVKDLFKNAINNLNSLKALFEYYGKRFLSSKEEGFLSSELNFILETINFAELLNLEENNIVDIIIYMTSFGFDIHFNYSISLINKAIEANNTEVVQLLLNQNRFFKFVKPVDVLECTLIMTSQSALSYAFSLNVDKNIIFSMIDSINLQNISENKLINGLNWCVFFTAQFSTLEIFCAGFNKFNKFVNVDEILLTCAVRNKKDTRIFEKLIKEIKFDHYNLLFDAIKLNKKHCRKILNILLNEGYKFDDKQKNSMLLIEILNHNHNDIRFVKSIISLGIDKYYRTSCGKSILHFVCKSENIDIAKLIIEINIFFYQDENDETIFDLAVKSNNIKIIKFLASYGGWYKDIYSSKITLT